MQRHDGTDSNDTMVPITVLRMVPIQRYRHQEDRFILSRKGIRYKYASYRNLLLSFGVLSKREDGNYNFEKRIDTITRIVPLKNKKKTEERLLEELRP